MKAITKYVTTTGAEFYDKKSCLGYEKLMKTVDGIMSSIEPPPEDNYCNFANGAGFLQHDKLTVLKIRSQLLELCKKYIDHEWIQQSIDDSNVHLSYVGRLVGDNGGLQPIERALCRLMCTDVYGREWGQPYYVTHPDKAKQVCLNG